MRTLSVLALLLGLSLSPSALAGSKIPEIHKTGIKEVDPTFLKAKAIHDDLDTIHRSLKTANNNLATALNLPKETSLNQSLTELKKRGNNKINTVLEDGRWPRLKATDAVPSDVQDGIDAVNSLVDALKTSEATLKDMPAASKELAASAQKLPGRVSFSSLSQNNISITKLPKTAKKFKNNMKAVKATPERVERVERQTTSMATQVLEVFPAK